MIVDHLALESTNIDASVKWYLQILDNPKILYQDQTWALIESCGVKIAFVSPHQHPSHLGLKIDSKEQEEDLRTRYPNAVWKEHRDRSKSFYVRDPSGNLVEFIKYEV